METFAPINESNAEIVTLYYSTRREHSYCPMELFIVFKIMIGDVK